MRHVFGIGLAIVMALAMFFAGAWGYLRLLRLPAPAAVCPPKAVPSWRITAYSPRWPRWPLLAWRRASWSPSAGLAARRRAARVAAHRLDGAVPGQRPPGGRVDPPAVERLRGGMGEHAFQGPGRCGPGDDRPAVPALTVAASVHGGRSRDGRGQRVRRGSDGEEGTRGRRTSPFPGCVWTSCRGRFLALLSGRFPAPSPGCFRIPRAASGPPWATSGLRPARGGAAAGIRLCSSTLTAGSGRLMTGRSGLARQPGMPV